MHSMKSGKWSTGGRHGLKGGERCAKCREALEVLKYKYFRAP
jgi:hypothetical protein